MNDSTLWTTLAVAATLQILACNYYLLRGLRAWEKLDLRLTVVCAGTISSTSSPAIQIEGPARVFPKPNPAI